MGFKRKARHFRLKFADEQYEGFECTLKALNVDDFLSLTELSQDAKSGADNTRKILELMGASLVGWNLEEESGKAVPANLKGLRTLELDFTMDILLAWMDAMAGVNPNLPKTSSDGNPSLEASMAMETL